MRSHLLQLQLTFLLFFSAVHCQSIRFCGDALSHFPLIAGRRTLWLHTQSETSLRRIG